MGSNVDGTTVSDRDDTDCVIILKKILLKRANFVIFIIHFTDAWIVETHIMINVPIQRRKIAQNTKQSKVHSKH